MRQKTCFDEIIERKIIMDNQKDFKPYVPASKVTPELTITSIVMGIILVFLFNYFINFYFVNPLLRISEGISDYIQRKRSYNVTVDNDDELKELNENVKELVESNRKLSKKQ